MWLFPGKGPSQRLGDGNGIFNKWPGKLLIIVPFLGLQFLCPESLSNNLRLLVLNKVKAGILKLCPKKLYIFCLEHFWSICHSATLFVVFVDFVKSPFYVFFQFSYLVNAKKDRCLLFSAFTHVNIFVYLCQTQFILVKICQAFTQFFFHHAGEIVKPMKRSLCN